eukprot:CAMPEP_0194134638 /NCGR_PEP_ID=MMETSP0152-20130528/4710_1 /TAXON_ID=1049557 /ORGANISM="Thalassiothrix antarctica, Strain L6-D1" /LENGTH=233 /DNA_ID=CAMNT_0038830465 /DNA_START=230 /DNA_END=931 /DNA_ORIENTATION=+
MKNSEGILGNGNRGAVKVLKNIAGVLTKSVSKLASGYANGFMVGTVWRILSGGRGGNDAFAWGLNFGFSSALFEASNGFSQMLLRSDNIKDQKKRSFAVKLWISVIRNCIMAVFFNRMKGVTAMLKSAAIYSVLTYFFISRRRDSMGSMNMNGMNMNDFMSGSNMNGSNMNGANQQASMLKIMQMIQQQREQEQGGAQPPPQQQKKKETKASLKPSEFLDVEWSDKTDETEEK